LVLVDVLIVMLTAGLIVATLIPQLVEKKEKGQMELSRKNMRLLSQAEEVYFQAMRTHTSNVKKLEALTPELRDLVVPNKKAYTIALPDSQSYIIICPLGYGHVLADSTGPKFSWE